ncbi:Chitobiosyldiphosphodolichol beta-mannosyltransferase [Scheffersomyces coipomensis]|uniref:Chitobiosyldiphosphodolichol beta-mannosyltransferase n=1 Tax=Scheffersomyces coipomensis TaxID=1788519 RepID=UPI00315CEB5C
MYGPWLYWLIGFYLCLPITAYVILPYIRSKGTYSGNRKSIAIIVLGDLGHSPRICYQAKSFSNFDYYVTLCGYLESEPPMDVIDDINIDINEIKPIKNSFHLPYLLFAGEKVCLQLVQLFKLLLGFRGTDYILLQNPPSIPILLLVIIFKKIFSPSTFIIVDWHNLNYTILNLKFQNENHPVIRAVRFYEQFLGKHFVDLNMTVTKMMKTFLVKEFQFTAKKVITLYDRPSNNFQPLTSTKEKQEIIESIDVFNDIPNINNYKILISSTSFTPDEDFNVLLTALEKYHTQIETTKNLPPILLIVTGKGPLKNDFLTKVKQLDFNPSKIIIKSTWLAIEDYPKVLSVADLSVSLHTSSSGIDLPMKIVDFFGSGIPVISLNFPAINELVKHGINGLVTSNKPEVKASDEIYRLLFEVFTNDELLSTLKEGALEESKLRWDENWNNTLGKFFDY